MEKSRTSTQFEALVAKDVPVETYSWRNSETRVWPFACIDATTIVVNVEHCIVCHQVAIVEEQSVESDTGSEFELFGSVPLVLHVNAQFVEGHAGCRARLAIVAIGKTNYLRCGTIDEVVNTVVAVVTCTVTHILVVCHLVLIAQASHEFVLAEIECHVVLHVPYSVVYGVVISEELIAKCYVVVSVA